MPEYSFRITGNEDSRMILDPIRKKYVKLTEEEWVRQNFIQYLIREGKYPAGLIGVEVSYKPWGLKRRVDILVHNRKGEPVLIVECKSPDVPIDDTVRDQLGEYNMKFKVPFVIVTNGIRHYAFKYDPVQNLYDYMVAIPLYEDLLS
jgi:hypothetical protein